MKEPKEINTDYHYSMSDPKPQFSILSNLIIILGLVIAVGAAAFAYFYMKNTSASMAGDNTVTVNHFFPVYLALKLGLLVLGIYVFGSFFTLVIRKSYTPFKGFITLFSIATMAFSGYLVYDFMTLKNAETYCSSVAMEYFSKNKSEFSCVADTKANVLEVASFKSFHEDEDFKTFVIKEVKAVPISVD